MTRTIHMRLSEEEYKALKRLKSELYCGTWKGLVFKLRDILILSDESKVSMPRSAVKLKDTQNIFSPVKETMII